jgi:predicted acetylornithine/succinylornithine family transaminase
MRNEEGYKMTTEAMERKAIGADQIRELDREYVMGTYARQPVVFVRGEGARLWDSDDREYLDFLAGIAVVGVGHCHPHVAAAVAGQAHTLMHVSNIFHNPLQPQLAERLCRLSGMEKAFFCNSGTEANEAAIKIARKWGRQRRGDECFEIISFGGSFHGRTLGALSATAQPKYQAPFAPLVPGFDYAPLNDLPALKKLVSAQTCAVLIEPIQGESGVHVADPDFLRGVRALCDEADVLLIFDEIQCGLGRTGTFLASQGSGVQADIVTLAKGIADGFPMGCCLARGAASQTLVPGDHGSTFAGQPLACAAALATLDVLEGERLMENAARVGAGFLQGLRELRARLPGKIAAVRGRGLMVGVDLEEPVAKAVNRALFDGGIVANSIGDRTLRFVPPLIVTEADCRQVVDALAAVLAR